MSKLVSIPQAVSTVATPILLEQFRVCNHVSIPQAVSTVATRTKAHIEAFAERMGFNTASGKYCCNI